MVDVKYPTVSFPKSRRAVGQYPQQIPNFCSRLQGGHCISGTAAPLLELMLTHGSVLHSNDGDDSSFTNSRFLFFSYLYIVLCKSLVWKPFPFDLSVATRNWGNACFLHRRELRLPHHRVGGSAFRPNQA